MNIDFKNLREEEIELMYEAPGLVTILIAGADGKIDNKELNAATKFVLQPKDFWTSYFLEVGERMPVVLERWSADAAQDMGHVLTRITVTLRHLNRILPKLDKKDSVRFYDFLLQLAEEVAKSSGGVLGFNKVSKEEAESMSLSMIDNPARYQYC